MQMNKEALLSRRSSCSHLKEVLLPRRISCHLKEALL